MTMPPQKSILRREVASFAGWIATNQASVAAPTNSARIDALQMMSGAGDLPTMRFADYSLVYAGE